MLTPPAAKPIRSDFGLPEGSTLSSDDQNRLERSIAEQVRSYGFDDIEMPKAARIGVEQRMQRFWQAAMACSEGERESHLRAVATQSLSIPAAVVSALNAEKKYLAAMKQWESYRTWQLERNPARAELERRYGYDTKHAMHLVRLMRTGLEILQIGELRVRRPDADQLNSIRDGALSYEALMASAIDLESRMQAAAETSRLPEDVDHGWVDRLAFDVSYEFR